MVWSWEETYLFANLSHLSLFSSLRTYFTDSYGHCFFRTCPFLFFSILITFLIFCFRVLDQTGQQSIFECTLYILFCRVVSYYGPPYRSMMFAACIRRESHWFAAAAAAAQQQHLVAPSCDEFLLQQRQGVTKVANRAHGTRDWL